RRSVTPHQVRHPADCRFTSGCSPPRLAATQSPSITEPATGSGADLHRAVKASSRTHLPRRKPGPIVPPHQPFLAGKLLRPLQEIPRGGGMGPGFPHGSKRLTENELSDFSPLWDDDCMKQSSRHKMWTEITRRKYERGGQ